MTSQAVEKNIIQVDHEVDQTQEEFPLLGQFGNLRVSKKEKQHDPEYFVVPAPVADEPETEPEPSPVSLSTTLARTKPCNMVLNAKDGEEFGVCTRAECTFAHSLEELQAPKCGYDGNCRFMHGRVDPRSKRIIDGTKCKFRHTSETFDMWMKRSNTELPNLPPTNTYSRKPKETNEQTGYSRPHFNHPAGNRLAGRPTYFTPNNLSQQNRPPVGRPAEYVERPHYTSPYMGYSIPPYNPHMGNLIPIHMTHEQLAHEQRNRQEHGRHLLSGSAHPDTVFGRQPPSPTSTQGSVEVGEPRHNLVSGWAEPDTRSAQVRSEQARKESESSSGDSDDSSDDRSKRNSRKPKETNDQRNSQEENGMGEHRHKFRSVKKIRQARKSSSDDSDSSEDGRRSRRSKRDDHVQVIRVPTKELAEIAMKAAFDRGQFNIKIVIE